MEHDWLSFISGPKIASHGKNNNRFNPLRRVSETTALTNEAQADAPSDLNDSQRPRERQRPWEMLLDLAADGDAEALDRALDQMTTGEQALALSRMSDEQQAQILTILSAVDAAEVISHLGETQAAGMIESLLASDAAAIVAELDSDRQADLLGDLDDELAEAILSKLPSAEAIIARQLVAYDDDTAGGLMKSEFLRFDDQLTAAELINTIGANVDNYRDLDVQYAYLCNSEGRLTGVLPMRDLLFARRIQPVHELMITNPLSVQATLPLERLIEMFDTHHFLGVPVVDAEQCLIGVVHREAVDYEASRRMETDYLKSQGIVSEELRTMPLWDRARRRLSWLSINVVLNVGAASVIAGFQDTLEQVIALAVFLPIISDMSGCSGNQAVAVSMRELSLGLVRPNELARVWLKELGVGLINGLALGLLVAVVATFWNGNPFLGLVVGFALFANTIIAVSIGGTVPLVMKRFGVDPAVASGPLLTTVTDMCGFFLVLGIATMMISKLV